MKKVKTDRLSWRAAGETVCSCCGATYRIETAPLPERRDGYARCEVCETLLDEWICDQARRYERVSGGRGAAKASPGETRPAL
ncbi:MAG: hypothetical protein AAFW46_14005 [Pseudomonadota bacterium]